MTTVFCNQIGMVVWRCKRGIQVNFDHPKSITLQKSDPSNECRIEGEKFVIHNYHWSVEMLQDQYDNRDNLERLYSIVWHAGSMKSFLDELSNLKI